ncbi:MAG: bifunctional phosphopantothenoylcysteine decarboxylase/phosphopantothenate--cysteine ligase CoaBC, partial [Polaromonas sp.]|nr:bifunctional phosphopantothenoylcysteine decarboxylase/phosphopantothenate--cysteine ligase CoaBC [Polaromonas sp.]
MTQDTAPTRPPTDAPAALGEPLELSGRHIVLGLSGGIACYKGAELCRELIKAGASVQVVMTEAAEQFITPVTMQALSGRPVFTSQWDSRAAADVANNMAHINLSRGADAILIAPCSADFMARLLHGSAADLLSLLCLARPLAEVPLLLAPAMNREMYAHPATQRNLQQLVADGATILGVGSGFQACGETGDGRMLEPDQLLDDVIAFFAPKTLAGHSVLVTAGPTYEAIDPVRGITNLSSGKMGFAIARAAFEAGASVTLVAGPVALATPRGVSRIDVKSAQEMLEAVMERAQAATVFIARGGGAYWRRALPLEPKIKNDGSGNAPTLG